MLITNVKQSPYSSFCFKPDRQIDIYEDDDTSKPDRQIDIYEDDNTSKPDRQIDIYEDGDTSVVLYIPNDSTLGRKTYFVKFAIEGLQTKITLHSAQ